MNAKKWILKSLESNNPAVNGMIERWASTSNTLNDKFGVIFQLQMEVKQRTRGCKLLILGILSLGLTPLMPVVFAIIFCLAGIAMIVLGIIALCGIKNCLTPDGKEFFDAVAFAIDPCIGEWPGTDVDTAYLRKRSEGTLLVRSETISKMQVHDSNVWLEQRKDWSHKHKGQIRLLNVCPDPVYYFR
ncbi:MAG: hypothetical protein Q8Q03_00065 [bacterium]|nr:hypothetical protein [bacterium]